MADIQEIPHPSWSSYAERPTHRETYPRVFFRWLVEVFCRAEMKVRDEEKFFQISHSWGREENEV